MKKTFQTILGSIFLMGTLAAYETTLPSSQGSRVFLIENEFVRIWKAIVLPHETLKSHRHDTTSIVVGLKGGVLTRIEGSGQCSPVEYETGKAYWLPPDPVGTLHTEVNESDHPIEVMMIELKNFNAPGFGTGIDFDVSGLTFLGSENR